ncbi:tyrosine-type recombinase/integrase [Myxosarcina sp. GI1(2024)]
MVTLTAPSTESCNSGATPRRRKAQGNAHQDIVRDHLTASEVKLLIEAVKSKGGWYSYRNSILILVIYRHGLRRTETARMRWSDVDLKEGTIYIRRIKGSRSGRHPLQGDEMRALKKLKRDYEPSPFVFTGNRHTPLSERTISHIVHQAGVLAGFDFVVHAHLLRHACGYYLANKGLDTRTIQDYLGHANIQNTVRYTQLSAARFEGLWN